MGAHNSRDAAAEDEGRAYASSALHRLAEDEAHRALLRQLGPVRDRVRTEPDLAVRRHLEMVLQQADEHRYSQERAGEAVRSALNRLEDRSQDAHLWQGLHALTPAQLHAARGHIRALLNRDVEAARAAVEVDAAEAVAQVPPGAAARLWLLRDREAGRHGMERLYESMRMARGEKLGKWLTRVAQAVTDYYGAYSQHSRRLTPQGRLALRNRVHRELSARVAGA